MNRAEWQAVEATLQRLYQSVELDCDGYRLQIMLVRLTQFKNAIEIYVDGRFRFQWLSVDCEQRRRFCCPRPAQAYGRKQRAMFKAIGQRLAGQAGVDPNRKITLYDRWWTNFDSLRRHLERNNTTVAMITPNNTEAAA